ncbi:MAG: hypothetical protein LBJ88_03230 [Campylobacteraceae bacterium]|jgi:hypothetical protein|nr:hypothetical protein [Campylobacteraceae bacterium]
MRCFLLSLIFISLPLLAANILSYEIQENETGNAEVVLSFEGNWEGLIEQKNSDEEMIFVIKGLGVKLSAQNQRNSPNIEYIKLSQLSANESRLIVKSEQTYDALISNNTNEIRISLTPKSIPITIEAIANGANNESIVAYILDALLYVAIFLAALIAAFFIFVKVKLFPRANVKNIDIENNALHVEENSEFSDEKQDKGENTNNDEIIEPTQNKATKTKKSPTSQKKAKQTRSLFDL